MEPQLGNTVVSIFLIFLEKIILKITREEDLCAEKRPALGAAGAGAFPWRAPLNHCCGDRWVVVSSLSGGGRERPWQPLAPPLSLRPPPTQAAAPLLRAPGICAPVSYHWVRAALFW